MTTVCCHEDGENCYRYWLPLALKPSPLQPPHRLQWTCIWKRRCHFDKLFVIVIYDKPLSEPMMVNLLTHIKLETESGRTYLYNNPEDADPKLHAGDGNDDMQFRIMIFSYIRAKLFKWPIYFCGYSAQYLKPWINATVNRSVGRTPLSAHFLY